MTTTALKLTALALMFVDHIYEFIPGMPVLLTILGRISAPVFFFCAVWGFHYTHSRPVYLLRMYLCSALMGILNCVLNAAFVSPWRPCRNNIFSALFVICLFIWLWEKGRTPGKKVLMGTVWIAANALMYFASVGLLLYTPLSAVLRTALGWKYGVSLAVAGCLPNGMTCEGGFLAVSMGLVLYFCKGSRKELCWGYGIFCAGYLALLVLRRGWGMYLLTDTVQWMQVFALPLMLTYNGQKGRGLKYLFYLFYPLHIAVLFSLGNLLAMG